MIGEIPKFPTGPSELAAQAEQAIALADNPVERGYMLIAAIEEGAAVGPSDIIANSATVAEIHVQEHEHDLTAERLAVLLREQAVTAYAARGQFSEADELVAGFRGVNTRSYFAGICELLKHGHPGPAGAYARLGIEELRAMSKADIVEAGRPKADPDQQLRSETLRQLTYMRDYLAALGGYGTDVFRAEGEHGDLLAVVRDLAERTNMPGIYQAALFDLGEQYVAGGNLPLAEQSMRLLTRLVPRAELGFEILEKTGNVFAAPGLFAEVVAFREDVEKSVVLDGNPQGVTPYELFMLQMRVVELNMRHGYDAVPLLETMATDPEARKHADIQLSFHLDLYRRTGNGTAREIALGYISRTLGRTPAAAAGYIRDIAEADQVYNYVMQDFDGEAVPMVCWELDQVFWGDRKYAAQMAGEDYDQLNRFQGFIPVADDVESGNVYGPHSADSGDFIDDDIRRSRETRDRVSAALVAYLAERNMTNSARWLLETIETPTEQVRATLALARELHRSE